MRAREVTRREKEQDGQEEERIEEQKSEEENAMRGCVGEGGGVQLDVSPADPECALRIRLGLPPVQMSGRGRGINDPQIK